ncbi:MAG: LytTR family transcriptional regulator [Gammaproteobacteria bacterium]|nr:LytTR family transcriptional regulator [Gammaproteobacteria bacterium]MBT4892123.1 LytTR family transcriptional regulator [Gammaproteobacteria bacterium]
MASSGDQLALNFLMIILDKKFWKFHALYWLGVAVALFIYGLSYGHWQVALVRNIYSPIVGFSCSYFIGIFYQNKLSASGGLRLLTILALSVLGAIVSAMILNPITYGLLGYDIQNMSPGNLTQDGLYFVLFYLIWSLLFLQRGGQTLLGNEPAPQSRIETINVSKGAKKLKLQPSDICFIQASGDYVEFFTEVEAYLKQGTIGFYEEELAAESFHRIHRSIIINADKIISISGPSKAQYFIKLEGGHEVRSSRNYQDQVAGLIPTAN